MNLPSELRTGSKAMASSAPAMSLSYILTSSCSMKSGRPRSLEICWRRSSPLLLPPPPSSFIISVGKFTGEKSKSRSIIPFDAATRESEENELKKCEEPASFSKDTYSRMATNEESTATVNSQGTPQSALIHGSMADCIRKGEIHLNARNNIASTVVDN